MGKKRGGLGHRIRMGKRDSQFGHRIRMGRSAAPSSPSVSSIRMKKSFSMPIHFEEDDPLSHFYYDDDVIDNTFGDF